MENQLKETGQEQKSGLVTRARAFLGRLAARREVQANVAEPTSEQVAAATTGPEAWKAAGNPDRPYRAGEEPSEKPAGDKETWRDPVTGEPLKPAQVPDAPDLPIRPAPTSGQAPQAQEPVRFDPPVGASRQ